MSGYTSKGCLIFCLIGLVASGSTLLAGPPPVSPKTVSRGSSAFSLKAEEALQKPVSLEATDLPLGDLLKDLSRKANVSLTGMAKIEDQRVTLHLTTQPLHQVMSRLCGLLSHSPETPHGYFWAKESRDGDSRPRYRLLRDLRSLADEQNALDIPRRKAIVLLRDWRNLSRMSPEKRKHYKSDLTQDYLEDPDMKPFQDAITNASDDQIDTLVKSGSLPLDPGRFASEIAHFNQIWHDALIQQRQRILKNNGPDPYPEGVPAAPPEPPTVTFHVDDYGGEHPERAAFFGLALHGIQTLDMPGISGSMHVTFSPLRKLRPPFPKIAVPGETIIDLSPFLTSPEVTPEQRGDVGFTVQALAKAGGLSLYQEEFYKSVYWGGRSNGLKIMKGTVPQLLNEICAEWDYDAKKVGDDYFLWSNTWAQDRAYDVPERLLADWRLRFQKQNGGYTLNDRVEIATALTWPQIFITLSMLLPEAGTWNGQREAEILRFIGGFTASERSIMAGQGLPLAAMSPVQQMALLDELRDKIASASQARILHARLFLKPDLIFQAEGMKRETLQVKSEEDQTLWETQLLFSAASVKNKTDAPR